VSDISQQQPPSEEDDLDGEFEDELEELAADRSPEFLDNHAQSLIGGGISWPNEKWFWERGVMTGYEIIDVENTRLLLLIVAPDDGSPLRRIPVVYDSPDYDVARSYEEHLGHYLSWHHGPGKRYPRGYCRWHGKQ
jgi:hypothetical protein